MTIAPNAYDEPGPEPFESGLRVLAYVRGGDSWQRAFETTAIVNYCHERQHDIVRVIHDDCAQHTTMPCSTFSSLVCDLYDNRCDLVVPRLDHLSLDSDVRDLMLFQLEATGCKVLVLPAGFGFSESGA